MTNNNKTAILLLNVGSPKTAKIKDVRRYLSRFLYDRRVISIPKIFRWILVNLIIAPFRAPKSAKLYKQLWSKNDAPLVYYGKAVRSKLQKELTTQADVYIGMAFGNPYIDDVLKQINTKKYKQLLVIPLFPQYASSSTGVVIEKVMNNIKNWTLIPKLKIINQFYNHPLFIKAFAEKIKSYGVNNYDYILFSYHGLPISHLNEMCTFNNKLDCYCETINSTEFTYCYKSTCYQTTQLLVNELGLSKNNYSVSFQSRMSNKWIQPFTDKVIKAKARQGIKNILVVAPSFIADCLETTIEIGFQYKKAFQEAGGKNLQLVESLNESETWINALKIIISENI